MSRYATAVDLHTWKARQRGAPRHARKPTRGARYAAAGSVAGEPRERRRSDDDDDDQALDGWEGDLEAELDADLREPVRREDLGDEDLGDEDLGDEDLGDEVRDEDEAGDDEEAGDDVGALRLGRRREGTDAPRRAGPLVRLRGGWAPPVALGSHLQVRARRGFRAAVVEVKPGLFVVAEVPQTAVEFGFGPLLLAPALVKTLARAFGRPQAGEGAGDGEQRPDSPRPAPRQLPGPAPDDSQRRTPRWVDGELAAELGCGDCEPRVRS